MPADSTPSRGDWRIWDHGDEAVDQFWRKLLGNPVQRHASLGGAIPPEDARYVAPEFANEGTIPESYFICKAIWAAS